MRVAIAIAAIATAAIAVAGCGHRPLRPSQTPRADACRVRTAALVRPGTDWVVPWALAHATCADLAASERQVAALRRAVARARSREQGLLARRVHDTSPPPNPFGAVLTSTPPVNPYD